MAGSRVLPPPRILDGGAKLLSATEGAANFSSKFGTKLGYAGMGLAAMKIGYELHNDKWNAHTFVDGSIIAVTITGMLVTVAAAGTAPVWVPIAGAVILVYGLADYTFDLGGQLDHSVGRHTNYWR